MPVSPYYTSAHVNPAYQLRYNWTGWPSRAPLPPQPGQDFFTELSERWEGDGIRLLEHTWTPDQIHIVTSTKPFVSPAFAAARIKGRLQHALREHDTPVKFRRKFAIRTIGEAKEKTVETYIENQVANSDFADPRFARFLRKFSVVDRKVDLNSPSRSRSGRYWYNLHLVLAVQQRCTITNEKGLRTLRDGSLKIAQVKNYGISRLAVMPDHLHLALRGEITVSPEDIALSFMNNLAYMMNCRALWEASYYVGTIGHYDMGVVRRCVARSG